MSYAFSFRKASERLHLAEKIQCTRNNTVEKNVTPSKLYNKIELFRKYFA